LLLPKIYPHPRFFFSIRICNPHFTRTRNSFCNTEKTMPDTEDTWLAEKFEAEPPPRAPSSSKRHKTRKDENQSSKKMLTE
jgi:hypothetical protein